MGEEAGEALVLGDIVEDGEGERGFVAGGAGVAGGVDVFVEGVVEAGSEGEGFHGDGAGVELVGVAEVDEGVSYWFWLGSCDMDLCMYVCLMGHVRTYTRRPCY